MTLLEALIYCIFIAEMGEKIKTSEISEILESICAQNELEWRKLNVRFLVVPGQDQPWSKHVCYMSEVFRLTGSAMDSKVSLVPVRGALYMYSGCVALCNHYLYNLYLLILQHVKSIALLHPKIKYNCE